MFMMTAGMRRAVSQFSSPTTPSCRRSACSPMVSTMHFVGRGLSLFHISAHTELDPRTVAKHARRCGSRTGNKTARPADFFFVVQKNEQVLRFRRRGTAFALT